MSRRSSRTVYVGNLPGDIREREVEDLFLKSLRLYALISRAVILVLDAVCLVPLATLVLPGFHVQFPYGHITHIDLKVPPRPPGYAFVEFEDAQDAEDAIRGRDGYDFDGHRWSLPMVDVVIHPQEIDTAVTAMDGLDVGYPDALNIGGSPACGTPRGAMGIWLDSWPSASLDCPLQHPGRILRSFMMEGVCDTWMKFLVHNCARWFGCIGTTGIVDYTNYDDMKYAIKKLDDSEFRNAFSKGYVRVWHGFDVLRDSSRSPSRGPSHSRGRSYSRSRSRSRSYSRDRSQSKSPKGKSSQRSPPAKSPSRSPAARSRSRSRSRSLSGMVGRLDDFTDVFRVS
ncbi:hypothetical protein V8G54_017970 [Vigna mungo]|uniref:RRM domain-containing protein n=1 Tax=Vigna mungo TaxID=3915 RepID=A0AAQ3RU44_VIGMU